MSIHFLETRAKAALDIPSWVTEINVQLGMSRDLTRHPIDKATEYPWERTGTPGVRRVSGRYTLPNGQEQYAVMTLKWRSGHTAYLTIAQYTHDSAVVPFHRAPVKHTMECEFADLRAATKAFIDYRSAMIRLFPHDLKEQSL